MLLYFSNSFGQNLNPNMSILDMPEYQYNYYSKIRKKLLKNNYENTVFQLVVLPSFQPEYILRIVKSDNKYYGIITKADENIWYSKNFEILDSNTYISLMKSEDIELLSKSIEQILSKTQYSETTNYATDGIRYILSNNSKSGTFRTGDNFMYFYCIRILENLITKIINDEEAFLNEEEIKELKSKI
jgi:hypothetical protein